MNAILFALQDSQKMRTFLFWYWIISPLIFFFYQYSVAASSGVAIQQMLQEPGIALAFLSACMSLTMAGLLRASQVENERIEGRFALFATVQQLVTGNILGFLLSYFLTRSLRDVADEPFAPRLKPVLLAGMVLMGLLSLLLIIANINLATSFLG